MNEEQINRILLITSAVVAAVSGLATVGLIIETAMTFTWAALMGAILLAVCCIGAGCAVSYYGTKVTGRSAVFDNAAEREVLTLRQRRELRRMRGEVVMEKATIDIEHERANIVHNLELEATDENVPPHETPWTRKVDDTVKQIRPRPDVCEHGEPKGDCHYIGCPNY